MIKYPIVDYDGIPKELLNSDWLPIVESETIKQNAGTGALYLDLTALENGGHYIWNQFSVAQSANAWIDGKLQVGAGIMDVSSKFQVDGNTRINGVVGIYNQYNGINIMEIVTTNVANNVIAIRKPTLGQGAYFNFNSVGVTRSATDPDWRFGMFDNMQTNGKGIGFATYDGTTVTTRMYILPTGSVGIGTYGPSSVLHISSSNPAITLTDAALTGPAGLFQLSNSGDKFNIAGRNAAASVFESIAEFKRIAVGGEVVTLKGNTGINGTLRSKTIYSEATSILGSGGWKQGVVMASATAIQWCDGTPAFSVWKASLGVTDNHLSFNTYNGPGPSGLLISVNGGANLFTTYLPFKINTIANATTHSGFLVTDGGVVKYRTAAEVRSDLSITDTNFGNSDISFTGHRTHNLLGYNLYLDYVGGYRLNGVTADGSHVMNFQLITFNGLFQFGLSPNVVTNHGAYVNVYKDGTKAVAQLLGMDFNQVVKNSVNVSSDYISIQPHDITYPVYAYNLPTDGDSAALVLVRDASGRLRLRSQADIDKHFGNTDLSVNGFRTHNFLNNSMLWDNVGGFKMQGTTSDEAHIMNLEFAKGLNLFQIGLSANGVTRRSGFLRTVQSGNDTVVRLVAEDITGIIQTKLDVNYTGITISPYDTTVPLQVLNLPTGNSGDDVLLITSGNVVKRIASTVFTTDTNFATDDLTFWSHRSHNLQGYNLGLTAAGRFTVGTITDSDGYSSGHAVFPDINELQVFQGVATVRVIAGKYLLGKPEASLRFEKSGTNNNVVVSDGGVTLYSQNAGITLNATTVIVSNLAGIGTRMVAVDGSGNLLAQAIPSPALTNTYIGVGNASNILAGSASLTFDGTTLRITSAANNDKKIILNDSLSGGFVGLGVSDTSPAGGKVFIFQAPNTSSTFLWRAGHPSTTEYMKLTNAALELGFRDLTLIGTIKTFAMQFTSFTGTTNRMLYVDTLGNVGAMPISNFAVADLIATGNRTHNFNNRSLTINSFASNAGSQFEMISSGRLKLRAVHTTDASIHSVEVGVNYNAGIPYSFMNSFYQNITTQETYIRIYGDKIDLKLYNNNPFYMTGLVAGTPNKYLALTSDNKVVLTDVVAVAAPANQVLYGTGTGVASSTMLQYDPTEGRLIVGYSVSQGSFTGQFGGGIYASDKLYIDITTDQGMGKLQLNGNMGQKISSTSDLWHYYINSAANWYTGIDAGVSHAYRIGTQSSGALFYFTSDNKFLVGTSDTTVSARIRAVSTLNADIATAHLYNSTNNNLNTSRLGLYSGLGITNTGALTQTSQYVTAGVHGQLAYTNTALITLHSLSHNAATSGQLYYGGTGNIAGNIISGLMGSVILENGTGATIEKVAAIVAFRPQRGAAVNFSGTITDFYGLYVDDISLQNTAGTLTNMWGIRQVGATVRNGFDGDIEFMNTDAGPVLRSPNGTRYRIIVDNLGGLSTETI